MISVGILANDKNVLYRIIAQSDMNGRFFMSQFNAESAPKGFNGILSLMKTDAVVLCHQDIYFPPGSIATLETNLKELPDSWVVAGPYGINESGEHCGKIHDRRVPLPMDTGHTLPTKALSIDGCCMVINRKSGFTFDENLEGFDLYDVYATLRARELGTAWIIDFPVEHYATRSWDWKPDTVFMKNWGYLKQRFPNERIISTCFRD